MMQSRIGSVSYYPNFNFENITTLQASNEMKQLQVAYGVLEKFRGLIVCFYLTIENGAKAYL